MTQDHKLIINKLHDITNVLASMNYQSVSAMCHNSRLNSEEIKHAIEEYGETLTPVPQNELAAAIIIEITNSKPKAWSVTCPLWSIAEGRSDLTLELTMTAIHPGKLSVAIDNIHTL